MVGERKKKYSAGEGSLYWSRQTAMKKLQLTLKDFRRLCILKGIYPREPRHRKRAQKGATGISTLYQKKDIQFLMHEPIIWKLREMKVHFKKMGRARGMRDFGKLNHLKKKHPILTLDTIVKERYPTFIDALRDLDDCLTLCFLFSTFPSLPNVPRDQSYLCRRLTVEFMHAVIAARALRKVFVSIKGYYFQVELKGQTVTWIVPHQFCFEPQQKSEVDFRIMSTFVQFYTVMLGFVNFRLYHTLNLYYPPTFSGLEESSKSHKDLVDDETFASERIAALNLSVARTNPSSDDPEEIDLDSFPMSDDPGKLEEAKLEAEKIQKLKTLFKGLKVFLNREVPREPLVFTLRCLGAEVSWDKLLFVGATFDERDETITHQIVDRPSLDKQYISRYYVQPQWVFDSVNARELQPVEKYLIGCVLPPHLSPFVDPLRKDEHYVPIEESAMTDPSILKQLEDEGEEELDEDEEEESEEENHIEHKVKLEDKSEENDGQSSDEDMGSDVEEQNRKNAMKQEKRASMNVSMGKIIQEDPAVMRQEQYQDLKLRERMINKKHKNLYKSMMKGRRDRIRDKKVLMKKRQVIENQKQVERKVQKSIKTL